MPPFVCHMAGISFAELASDKGSPRWRIVPTRRMSAGRCATIWASSADERFRLTCGKNIIKIEYDDFLKEAGLPLAFLGRDP